jgi:hypothetical protein
MLGVLEQSHPSICWKESIPFHRHCAYDQVVLVKQAMLFCRHVQESMPHLIQLSKVMAQYNQFKILRFISFKGYPWDAQTTPTTVKADHFQLAK